jgi:hypothetical protein
MIAPVQNRKTAGALASYGAEPVWSEPENPICYLFAGALGESHFRRAMQEAAFADTH